ncbi:LytR/AlgR family response regulator transcription factor [Christiangramia forsetii]|uniref:Two-component system response regulator containing LytTR DNA-binding domain n=2 Tax=Christiangramia forsetii TaxID=411153 RepID=A0LZC2_CHRFK|nr:LytTR family DNA-binding domain-containing protein [Christiangramia forsetii]GGG37973.1 DNA-binding response regulator [Christiangramia forsetii]CAL65717.1 two-component system response regulator containing LytTR DNA-binding domain [Christiangramia forsetii KT0803]
MKALVIDDEELARRRVLNLLEDVEKIEVIGECSNGRTAIERINTDKPDLVFLDINMKDMNGFEVLKQVEISPKPIVIFVTAYDNYALKAFDAEAFDFLLKPFKDQRFFKTINKVLETTKTEANVTFEKRLVEFFHEYSKGGLQLNSVQKIPVKQGNKTALVDPNHILYIQASGYYAEIFVDSKKYVLRESLNNLSEILDSNTFVRIHRSTIANLKYVNEIIHSDYSEIDAKMTDGKLLHVSKSHKKEFLEKIGI